MAEDAQPNEFRLNRKGNTNVPLVRTTTRPRGATRGFRGRGGRGRPFTSFDGRPQYNAYDSPRYSEPSSFVSHASEVARYDNPIPPGQSARPSGGYHRGNNYGRYQGGVSNNVRGGYGTPQRPSCSSSFSEVPSAPQTRPHPPRAHLPEEHYHPPRHPAAAAPEHLSGSDPYKRSRRRRPPPLQRHVMLVDLPPDCHKGASSLKSFRALWVREQLPAIALQHGINISMHTWLDDQVRLEYTLKDELGARSPTPVPQIITHMDAPKELPERPPTTSNSSHQNQTPRQISQTSPEAVPPVNPSSVNIHPFAGLPIATPSNPAQAAAEMRRKLLSSSRTQTAGSSFPLTRASPQPINAQARNPSPKTSQASPPLVMVHARSSSPHDSQLALPRNPSMDMEIIDLTLDVDEPTAAIEVDSPDPSISQTNDGSSIAEVIGLDAVPEPRAASPVAETSKPTSTYSCLSVSSGSFTVDQAGLLRDHQPTRLHISSSTVTQPSRPAPTPANCHDEDLIPPIAHLQDSSDVEGDVDQLVDDEPSHSGWTEYGNEVLTITRAPYEKSRRLLSTSTRGLYAVTMRGVVQWMGWDLPREQRCVYLPDERSKENIDDACLVQSESGQMFVISAATRECGQISMMPVSNDGKLISPRLLFDRPKEKSGKPRKCGISAVRRLMQPGLFATGGHDHRVHIWTIPEDISKTSMRELAIKHSSIVQSLLPIRDTSHKLVTAGADCRVNVWDLASEVVVDTFKVSNSVFHLHRTALPYCMLLEIAHRELQFEIRDHRIVPANATVRFGFNTKDLQSRYVRGDVSGYNFACGDRDGNVRIWDIRQPTKETSIISCFPEHRTMDVAFRGGDVVAFSDDFRVKILSEDHCN